MSEFEDLLFLQKYISRIVEKVDFGGAKSRLQSRFFGLIIRFLI